MTFLNHPQVMFLIAENVIKVNFHIINLEEEKTRILFQTLFFCSKHFSTLLKFSGPL
jgi:hypothetical protein